MKTTYYELQSGETRNCTKPRPLKNNPIYFTAKDSQTKTKLILHYSDSHQLQGGTAE